VQHGGHQQIGGAEAPFQVLASVQPRGQAGEAELGPLFFGVEQIEFRQILNRRLNLLTLLV
jgi:hypothetical protein